MDYSNEEMKIGRLFGFAEALLENNYYSHSFEKWIDRINEKIEDIIIVINNEILYELMEMISYCNERVINGTTYMLIGDEEFEEELYGIVYLRGERIELISLEEFRIIRGYDEEFVCEVEFE
jgi:hypothetical protein